MCVKYKEIVNVWCCQTIFVAFTYEQANNQVTTFNKLPTQNTDQ